MHLLGSLGDDSALSSVGLPTLATSPTERGGRLIGSELMSQKVLPSVDLTFPLKLGSPHVVGVKALLPPKIPVRGPWRGRASTSFDRGRPQSLKGAARSRSFSPPAKRPRWHRARSQSPRPAWRPSSAKANASAEPPPPLPQRKNGVSRQFYRPGTLATRSRTLKAPGRMDVRKPWSPYGLVSTAISSPTAQEINDRFLQALAESSAERAVIEMSPYQRELARLRLERLRVEEAWLLELKRQQELERTRGPRAKC
nr:uncharacterized protein LOC110073297 [Pogona vitticeps]